MRTSIRFHFLFSLGPPDPTGISIAGHPVTSCVSAGVGRLMVLPL